MNKGHSEDLRERVLEYIEEGGKVKQAVKIFKVSTASINRWKKKKAVEGHVKNKQRTKWLRKVNREELREYIKSHPDQLLSEVGQQFGVSASTIHKNLKALNIVYKKNTSVCGKR
ncbi:IS630 transposase-related protein [Candidatus Albibeggiatoa sp. nov. BB20]|uniref:IS630 transposase-related protein n=1 Tax=Candidatus Albibeggiatoa sp. nov. BB20 TaxID=3162723 RepID=UPI003365AC7F